MGHHTFAVAVLELCSRVVTVVRITHDRNNPGIVLLQHIFPMMWMNHHQPRTWGMSLTTACRRRKQFISDGDASVLHIIEGSTCTKLWEESLMEYLVTLNLHIFSCSNKPTFVFKNMKELIDLEVRNLVNDLRVYDFRFMWFQKGSLELIGATARYPKKMNWELQR